MVLLSDDVFKHGLVASNEKEGGREGEGRQDGLSRVGRVKFA